MVSRRAAGQQIAYNRRRQDPAGGGHEINLPTLFNQFNLTNVRLNVAGVQVEVEINQDDRNAAWESYVEMLTRIVTQPLPADVGDEQTALDSVYSRCLRRPEKSCAGGIGGQFDSARLPSLSRTRWSVLLRRNGIAKA